MDNSLEIKNLYVSTIEGKEILRGISLVVRKGEIHALMGPNGSGKSTLANVLMGHPHYKITKGKISINEKNIINLSPDQRAKLGLFLGFQYPTEVSGVNFSSFLRLAVNENSNEKLSPIAFRNILNEQAKKLSFAADMAKRSLNEGFSGGEKKKAEILQMVLLKPKFVVLDEPDSGLDVDALKYIVKIIKKIDYPFGLVLITHYQRILHYIKPDFVHILINGKIVKSGKAGLAKEVGKKGFENYLNNH